MSGWAIAGIIILILAVIMSNLVMLLKTAHHKLPSLPKGPPSEQKDKEDEDEDEKSSW